jgi:hypothetical protein
MSGRQCQRVHEPHRAGRRGAFGTGAGR